MPRILIIGDAVAPTGFARVIRSIFEPLHRDYELHQLATRYDGGPHDYPWKLYPARKGQSVYGYDQILPLITEIAPDIVFLLGDFSGGHRFVTGPVMPGAFSSKSAPRCIHGSRQPRLVAWRPAWDARRWCRGRAPGLAFSRDQSSRE